jgi:hypothetical protein
MMPMQISSSPLLTISGDLRHFVKSVALGTSLLSTTTGGGRNDGASDRRGGRDLLRRSGLLETAELVGMG